MVSQPCYDVLFVYVDLHIQNQARNPWLEPMVQIHTNTEFGYQCGINFNHCIISPELGKLCTSVARCPVYVMSAIAASNAEQKKETHIEC